MVQRLIEFWNALWSIFRLNGKESELDEEVRFHLEERGGELVEQGYDAKTANKMAIKEFGGVEKFKEETRDSWGSTCSYGPHAGCSILSSISMEKQRIQLCGHWNTGALSGSEYYDFIGIL